jgi:hypothetical protein
VLRGRGDDAVNARKVRYFVDDLVGVEIDDDERAVAEVGDVQPPVVRIEPLVVEARGGSRQAHVLDERERQRRWLRRCSRCW